MPIKHCLGEKPLCILVSIFHFIPIKIFKSILAPYLPQSLKSWNRTKKVPMTSKPNISSVPYYFMAVLPSNSQNVQGLFFKFLSPLSRSPNKNILEALQDLHCFLRIGNLTIISYQLLKIIRNKSSSSQTTAQWQLQSEVCCDFWQNQEELVHSSEL